jgi:hypothetical protein
MGSSMAIEWLCIYICIAQRRHGDSLFFQSSGKDGRVRAVGGHLSSAHAKMVASIRVLVGARQERLRMVYLKRNMTLTRMGRRGDWSLETRTRVEVEAI